jgi:hypothetical protein
MPLKAAFSAQDRAISIEISVVWVPSKDRNAKGGALSRSYRFCSEIGIALVQHPNGCFR